MLDGADAGTMGADWQGSPAHAPVPSLGPSGAPRRRFRTIWISDVHLGTRGCNAQLLIDFLDHVDSDTLYLVGDIIDGWAMKKRFYWPEAHNAVLRRLLQRAKRGTEVIFIPGNHDEGFRQFAGLNFGGVSIRRKARHHTADGRRLLVLHGDEFDTIVLAHRWLALLGDTAYTLLLRANVVVNAVRRWAGLPYWSLSKHAKQKVKDAVAFISRFEETVADAADRAGTDGVVCGHIHQAALRRIGPVLYANSGDWVESCTALVEHRDGRLEILHWADVVAGRPSLMRVATNEPVTA